MVEILSELSILVFLIIGAIITFIGRDGMSSKTSTMIQLLAIFLVLFSTVLNLLFSIVVIVKSIANIKNLVRYKNMKKKISKEYSKVRAV